MTKKAKNYVTWDQRFFDPNALKRPIGINCTTMTKKRYRRDQRMFGMVEHFNFFVFNFKFSSLELKIFFSALALVLSVINHGTTVRNCLILWQKGKTKGINRSMAVFQKDVQGLCGQMVNLVRNIAEVTEWINGEIQSCFGIIHVAFGRGQNVGTIQNIDTRRMLLM